jgi:hypothetical protein
MEQVHANDGKQSIENYEIIRGKKGTIRTATIRAEMQKIMLPYLEHKKALMKE